MASGTTKFEHRKILLQLVQRLSTADLEEMIFICEDVLSESTAEEIQSDKSATSLFRALEHRGKLAPNEYEFLRECLVNIGRDDLASLLPRREADQVTASLAALGLNETEKRVPNFAAKKLLLHISNQLRRRDLENMAYLCECEAGKGIELLQTLERNGCISAGNYDYLSCVLFEIGRNDLGQLLRQSQRVDYMQTNGQAMVGVDHMHSGVNHMQRGVNQVQSGVNHSWNSVTHSVNHMQLGVNFVQNGADHMQTGDNHMQPGVNQAKSGVNHMQSGGDLMQRTFDHMQPGVDHTQHAGDYHMQLPAVTRMCGTAYINTGRATSV